MLVFTGYHYERSHASFTFMLKRRLQTTLAKLLQTHLIIIHVEGAVIDYDLFFQPGLNSAYIWDIGNSCISV